MIRGETFSIPHSQERSARTKVNETAKSRMQVIDFMAVTGVASGYADAPNSLYSQWVDLSFLHYRL